MAKFNIGDIVVRKSYGEDIYFTITGIREGKSQKLEYVLKGVFYRIEADAYEEDLLKEDVRNVELNFKMEFMRAKKCLQEVLFKQDIRNIPPKKNTRDNFAY